MREVELKFQVPENVVASLRRDLLARGARSTRFVAHYFDTADGALASGRVSLRLRREGRRWWQTLKAEGETAVDRLEHNVAVRAAAGGLPSLDLARHDGTAAAARLHEALGDRPADLVERFSTDFVRLAAVVRWPGCELEAALDIGHLRAGERDAPLCELELEHLSGTLDGLFELARLWRGHGGLWLDTRSKARRGALLVDGRAHGAPPKARAAALHDGMDGDALVRAVVCSILDQVLGNASEIAAGSGDEEHVHQLRVGVRRLRTALREFAALAHGVDAAWEAPLVAAFQALGAIRDDDAVARAVEPLLRQAAAPKLTWQRAAGGDDAMTIVRGAALQDTLLQVLRWAMLPPPEGSIACTSERARAVAVARLAALHKQLVRAGARFDRLPTAEQHRERKRLKRLRYLAEFVAPLWSPKATQRYLRRLGAAQDALGRHNDAVVAGEKFRIDAEHDPRSWFAAGFLHAHRAVTARQARKALAGVADAPRFWKDAGRGD